MIIRNNNKIARYKGWPAESFYNYYASGGIVSYDGLYQIHTFNVSDNFIVNNTIDISTLIVGAGGSGGAVSGGGGGFVKLVNFTLSPSVYYVTIGHCPTYSNGTSSYFNGIESSGGLGAVLDDGNSASGKTGGRFVSDICGNAGGGGGGNTQNGGNGFVMCPPDPMFNMASGGQGGDGTHSSISGTDTGYGGGGGGNAFCNSNPGMQGSGVDGGGNSSSAGIPNTGGGGGSNGENGATGVVIIRYKYK